MFKGAILRTANADKLDFFELVLTNEAARVATRRTSFGAKAKSMSRQAHRVRKVIDNLPSHRRR
jgi:hypothetical protein